MRSILLHVEDDEWLESRLQATLDLARALDGHITCLQAVPFDVTMPGDFYGTLVSSMHPANRQVAARLREQLEERLAREDVRWDWIDETGLTDRRLQEHACMSDLVVLGSGMRDGAPDKSSPLAAGMAVKGLAPILVVPRSARGFDCAGPAVVAWNGSPEAGRALRAAVPLLSLAEQVHLVTVSERREEGFDLPAMEGSQYLSRHGIACEMADLVADGRSIADVLTDFIQTQGAAYLVMGAYGHSRLVENVFGGVTREMLTNPPAPLLLAH